MKLFRDVFVEFIFRRMNEHLSWIMKEMNFLKMVKYSDMFPVRYTIFEFLNLIGKIEFKK